MRKLFITILICFIPCVSFADTVETYASYSVGGTVTADNLNGNFNNIRNVLNGSINGVNIKSGWRLIEILNETPAAGTVGRLIYDKSQSTFAADTGSEFKQVPSVSSPISQGEIIYKASSGWATTGPGTTDYPLVSNGSSANPAFEKLNIITALSIASQATGDIIYASSAIAWTRLAVGSNGQSLHIDGGLPEWINNVQYFSSSDTFTAPNSTSVVFLTMCAGGGGGGGGGSGTTIGGGGGGGECVINRSYAVTGGNSYTVTIGAAGTAGAAGGSGGVGGDTSFDSLTLTGGSQGTSGNPGTGGNGGGSSLDGSGATGGNDGIKGGTGADASGGANGGGGGGTYFGSGGNGGSTGSGTAATANTGAGGGGGGSTGGATGGAGGSGFVLVIF